MNKTNAERHFDHQAMAYTIRRFLKEQNKGKMTVPATKLERDAKTYLFKFVEPQLTEGYTLYLNDNAASEATKLAPHRCRQIKVWLQQSGILILTRRQTINFAKGNGTTSYWILNRCYIIEKATQKKVIESLEEDAEAMTAAASGSLKKRQNHYGAAHRKVRMWAIELANLEFGDDWFEERYFWATVATIHTNLLKPYGLMRADFRLDACAEAQAAVEEVLPKIEADVMKLREELMNA